MYVCMYGRWETDRIESLPTDSHREGSLAPVSACYQRHLALGVGAGAVEYLVRVAVFGGVVELVRVGVGVGR